MRIRILLIVLHPFFNTLLIGVCYADCLGQGGRGREKIAKGAWSFESSIRNSFLERFRRFAPLLCICIKSQCENRWTRQTVFYRYHSFIHQISNYRLCTNVSGLVVDTMLNVS